MAAEQVFGKAVFQTSNYKAVRGADALAGASLPFAYRHDGSRLNAIKLSDVADIWGMPSALQSE